MNKLGFHIKIIHIISVFLIVTSCSSSDSTDDNTVGINFGDEIVVSSNSTGSQEILLADVDNDDDLDIVSVNQGKANVVYINNNIFASGDSFMATDIDPGNASDNQPLSGDLGDIDGDTFVDLVVANQSGPNYAYINNGSGGFSSRISIQTDSDLTRTVKLADLDNNNTLDLYAGNTGVNKIYINDGSGGFSPGVNIGTNADDTWTIKFADFNMSGVTDMLAGNPVATLCLHTNDGAGNLSACSSVTSGDSGVEIAVDDVDGDSDIDIVFGNNGNTSQLYINNGTGQFSYASTITSGTTFISASALGDLDGDNDIDYIVGTTGMPLGDGAQFPRIHLNDGLGSFDGGTQFGSNGDDTSSIALGDIDGDGDLDIVMGKVTGPIVVYENQN
ncbi:MAG: VCBS repeat-containing protein [Gammaproteobacteria bacterium]|nr:VCBS repeat-containing protein [Gammaproteobacteria bacterium]